MKSFILSLEQKEYFKDLLEYNNNGLPTRYDFETAMFGFLSEIEQRAKSIAVNKLPFVNDYDGNYYEVPVYCSEFIKCKIHDDKCFIFKFQKSQLSDPLRMVRTYVWEFTQHDMYIESKKQDNTASQAYPERDDKRFLDRNSQSFFDEYFCKPSLDRIIKFERAFNARLVYEKNCVRYDIQRPPLQPPKGERMSDYAIMFGTTIEEMKAVWKEVEQALRNGL